MLRIRKQVMFFALSLLLTACGDSQHFAPVADIAYVEPIPSSGVHRVAKGETLYEIAWRYGMDYRYLATRNQTAPSDKVQSGQVIQLRGKSANPSVIKKIPIPATQPAPEIATNVEPEFSTSNWVWPAKGKLISSFSASRKGINIRGKEGDPVYATASGKVVYCGDGLRRYGNLIIIKHNNLYLSAYAHNKQAFVKEGSWVKKGQKIAEMGDTGSDKVMLHFEIRRAGVPVNPMTLLTS